MLPSFQKGLKIPYAVEFRTYLSYNKLRLYFCIYT